MAGRYPNRASAKIIKDSMEREKLMVKNFVRKGQEEGRLRKDISAEALAVLISSIFHGLCVMQLSGMLPKEFPAIYRYTI